MPPAWTLISRGVLVVLASLLAVPLGPWGCSEEAAKASAGGADAACPSGAVKSPEGECACPAAMVPRAAGGCQPVGLPMDMPCPPGETLLAEGGCEPAGVAPEACGKGFEPDGQRGCNAIQPEEDCPEGLMAIPGETKCHEVAPCGSGTWGDIPLQQDTEFVDGAYSGGDSDGTKAKPWKTIQEGIDSAEKGAIVAVAAGSYKESVQINNAHKRVRLWGRCPSMVEVEGTVEKSYAIAVYRSSDSEVRGLAIRGPFIGLWMTGSMDVIADQLWIHHTGEQGVFIDNINSPSSMTLRSSLLEATTSMCVEIAGSGLTLERSVLRDTASSDGALGVFATDSEGDRANVTIRSSVISRTQGAGLYAGNSSARIEDTLIRDTRPFANGKHGEGVSAILDGKGGGSGDLTIRTSVIEDNRTFGVIASGPGLMIESTVIRGTRPDELGDYGRGVAVGKDELNNNGRGTMTIRGSLVEDSYDLGIAVMRSDALVEGTIVRDTKQGMNSEHGIGFIVQGDEGERSIATLRSSVIERSVTGGILVTGSDATIETSYIADTKATKEGTHGQGLIVQSNPDTSEPAIALVRSCLIERSVVAGVMVLGSNVTVETSHVRDVRASVKGTFGDGIMVSFLMSPATVRLHGTVVESSARAGIASFGGYVELDRMAVTCSALDINGETRNGTKFDFDDLGGTACGCPTAVDKCYVQSSGLEPPTLEGL